MKAVEVSRIFPPMLALVPGMSSARGESGSFQPYQADAHTLHLWHLDESGPPFADAVSNGASLAGLLNGAVAGKTSILQARSALTSG